MLLSLSRDLNLVQKIGLPAEENARSASTKSTGVLSAQPTVPELQNSAISALMAAISFFPALCSAAALLVDGRGAGKLQTTWFINDMMKTLKICIEIQYIFNPEIPGLGPPNPGISGLIKRFRIPGFRDPGIRDPGIAIPTQASHKKGWKK